MLDTSQGGDNIMKNQQNQNIQKQATSQTSQNTSISFESTHLSTEANTAIQSYLEAFRHLKYGILSHTLETDKGAGNHEQLIVIEAPCFTGDLSPVCQPGYFELTERMPQELCAYYIRSEALIHQRFEEIRVWDMLRMLRELVWDIQFDQARTRAHVIFTSEQSALHYEEDYKLNALELNRFVRDLVNFGEVRAEYHRRPDYAISLQTIVEVAERNIQNGFAVFRWSVSDAPWLPESTGDCLVLEMPMGNAKRYCNYTNDVNGISSLIGQMLRELLRRDPRNLIPDPNAGRDINFSDKA